MARVRAQEVTPKWLEAVRQQYGTNSKYCAVGYCFGGPFVMNLAGTDDIVAGVFWINSCRIITHAYQLLLRIPVS
ncbi:hypothetical protein DFH06DRAFT_254050 [Mycena polygramma]|nr:hypothetical protein DFH06DRAFT_254050 [Mycena polygramma]